MKRNNTELHIDFERGNLLVWIVCAAALLWLLLKASGVLAADVNLSWDAAIGADTFRLAPGRCHPQIVFQQLREGNCIIKMLHQHGGNPLFSLPNSRNVRKALLNLEFISVAEQFMTPLVELADVVLPAAHLMQRRSLQMLNFSENAHPAVLLSQTKSPRF